jgi:tetratricopeptide (TPR) repeat protein
VPFVRSAALLRTLLLLLVGSGICGCASAPLDTARRHFYAGRFAAADSSLTADREPAQDLALYLMERGTIRQLQGRYDESSADLIAAYDHLERLRTYSVSQGVTSLVVNDAVQDFRGYPFERTLLHAFTAKNHLAMGHWEHAAVEARRIIHSLTPELRGDYPEDAYSRYMAGFCLELVGDHTNAALQYRLASELAPNAGINAADGRLGGEPAAGSGELVCFIGLGQAAPAGRDGDHHGAEFAEIWAASQRLGRTYTLADTRQLAAQSLQQAAARKTAKTVGRVAIKESISQAIERENEAFGDLARLLLIGLLERPDTRSWRTLPRLLAVARVPCAPGITAVDVVFKRADGQIIERRRVSTPLQRNGRVTVTWCRDIATSTSLLDN